MWPGGISGGADRYAEGGGGAGGGGEPGSLQTTPREQPLTRVSRISAGNSTHPAEKPLISRLIAASSLPHWVNVG